MTEPFVEHDKKAEEPKPTPVPPTKKAEELAVDLAEEWAQPEGTGESNGS